MINNNNEKPRVLARPKYSVYYHPKGEKMSKYEKCDSIKIDDTWDLVKQCGIANEGASGINELSEWDLESILGTMNFFGASESFVKQTYFDLSPYAKPIAPKFMVWDWLRMNIMGRAKERADLPALKVLVHSFLKSDGSVADFIRDLQSTDYQVDSSYSKILS